MQEHFNITLLLHIETDASKTSKNGVNKTLESLSTIPIECILTLPIQNIIQHYHQLGTIP